MRSRTTCIYGRITSHGHITVRVPHHPRADPKGFVLERMLVAKAARGGSLPPGCVIHHLDHDRANNAHWILYALPDQAEHNHVHADERRRDLTQLELWIGIENDWWAARNRWLLSVI